MRVKHVLISLGLVAFLGGAGFVAAKGYDLWQAEQRIEKAIKNIDVLSADQLVTDRVVARVVLNFAQTIMYLPNERMDGDLEAELVCRPLFGDDQIAVEHYSSQPVSQKWHPTFCDAMVGVAEGRLGLFVENPYIEVAGMYSLLAPRVEAFRTALRYKMWTILGCDPDVLWAFYQKKKPSIIKAFQALPADHQGKFVRNLEYFDRLVEQYRQPGFRKAVNMLLVIGGGPSAEFPQAEYDAANAAYEKAIEIVGGPFGIGEVPWLHAETGDTLVDEYQRIAADLRATLNTKQ